MRLHTNAEQLEVILLWLYTYIDLDCDGDGWVTSPRVGKRKKTLTLMTKFFFLFLLNKMSPNMANNLISWIEKLLLFH